MTSHHKGHPFFISTSGEPEGGDPRWTDFAGMGLIMAGLAVALLGRGGYVGGTGLRLHVVR